MKSLPLYCGIAAMFFVGSASAQNVDVEKFETYADTTSLRLLWKSVAGNGGEVADLVATGGANGSAQWAQLTDTGYTAGIGATNVVAAPTAGTYKLNFYYKNGFDGKPRWRGLKVSLLQNSSVVQTVIVNPGTTGAAPDVPTWTFAESAPFTITGDALSIRVDSNVSNGALTNYTAAIDEIVLIKQVNPALSVFPDDRIYLSGSETIVASVSGGSGTYSKVDFDVNNDGSVEFSDTAAPFQYTWNTLVDVPAGTSRTLSTTPANTAIPLKITVTDSASGVATLIENYSVDNEFGGRESMVVNGDFSQFQDGTNFGTNLPVGWTTQLVSPNATYGPAAESYSPAAGQSLNIQFSGGNNEDNTDRYTLRTDGKTGRYRDMQATWWGKGSFCRLYYATSTDNGATFVVSAETAGAANSSFWVFVVESPVQSGPGLGLTDTTQVSLATHTLGAAAGGVSYFWDDLTWEGLLIPAGTGVNEWNLY